MKRGDRIDHELESLAPGLSKLQKDNPFEVPANYFAVLPDAIEQKIRALPDLEKASKEIPFIVPEGYFDSLSSAVQQRIALEKNKSVVAQWASLLLRPKFSLSLALILILAIAGIKYFS